MPLYDIQKAYGDHIRSLSAEQRKTFGTNLKNALDTQISNLKNKLPPLGPNDPPYTDVQLVGGRAARVRAFAEKLESGAYPVPAAGGLDGDALLEADLTVLCEGLNTEEEASDNALFNLMLIHAKDPAAYANFQMQPTDARYEISRKDRERELYFNKYPEMEKMLGGRNRLSEEEIAQKREENRPQRDDYAAKIANILKKAFANANTRSEQNAVSLKLSSLFSTIAYNVGLAYRTGINLDRIASTAINKATGDAYDFKTNSVKWDELNQKLTEAANKIANADLSMYLLDKLDGIEKYLDDGDASHLDPDIETAFLDGSTKALEQKTRDLADNIAARPRVTGRKTPEEVSELMFRGYLNVRGDNFARMKYLTSLHSIDTHPCMKDTDLFYASFPLFLDKLIQHECMTNGAPDPEKYKQFAKDTAAFLYTCHTQIGSARTFEEATGDYSLLAEDFSAFENGEFITRMNEIAAQLHLPELANLQSGYMQLLMNDPDNAAKRSSFSKKEQNVTLVDPVELRKQKRFNANIKDLAYTNGIRLATDLINATGGALFVDETDARDMRNALSFVDRASEQGLFPNSGLAQKFRNELREYSALLDKAAADPMTMTSNERNRMYDLQKEFIKTCVNFVRGDEQNPAPAEGSIGRDCAMAVYQVLKHNYAEHEVMGGQEPSAARRIENEQNLISARNGVPTDLQIARILASRQIAESVRGSRAKLDQRHVDPRELNELTMKLLDDPLFRQFMQQHQNDGALRAAAIPPGHGGRIDDMFRGHILNLPAGELPDRPLLARYMPTAADRIKVLGQRIRAMLPQPQTEALAKAAAEILAIRKAAHAHGDDAKSLSAPIPAGVKQQAEALAGNEAFRQLLSADGVAALGANGLGKRLEERLLADYHEDNIPFLNTCTVNGRIGEICREDALRLQDTLRGAIERGDSAAIAKIRQTYFGLISELIALDEVAHAGGRDAVIPWETVDKKISGIRSNKAYQSVIENISSEIMLSDLVNLSEDAAVLDGDGVVAAMQTLEKNHRPWKTAADRMNDEMRQIKAAERSFLERNAAVREEQIRQYMNEAAQREQQLGRPASPRRKLRADAEKRWERNLYSQMRTHQKSHYLRMLAAEQLSGGSKNVKLSFQELQDTADKLENDPMVRDFLDSFRNDPKALHDLAVKGSGAFRKAFQSYLLNRPARELENSEVISSFMPTYLERIEALQAQEKSAREERFRAAELVAPAQQRADTAVAAYCRARDLPYQSPVQRNDAEEIIMHAAEDAYRKAANHEELDLLDREAQKAWAAIQNARNTRNQADDAEYEHSRTIYSAAAETVALRNMAHAARKEKSRLERPIRADGAISLTDKTRELSGSAAFRAAVNGGAKEFLRDGHGGEMYLRIAEINERKLNAPQENGSIPEQQFRDVKQILKANTVGARLEEIRQAEAPNLSRKLAEAQEAHNDKAVTAVAESYKKLLAEVIVLNNASQNGGPEQPMNHKNIARAIERSGSNASFARMTHNLNAAKLGTELTSLHQDEITQFLARQAQNLENANVQQPVHPNQPEDAVHDLDPAQPGQAPQA